MNQETILFARQWSQIFIKIIILLFHSEEKDFCKAGDFHRYQAQPENPT
jgi:hypothetical protein